jgi:hypothetical protein
MNPLGYSLWANFKRTYSTLLEQSPFKFSLRDYLFNGIGIKSLFTAK